jgi:hypothetical protein
VVVVGSMFDLDSGANFKKTQDMGSGRKSCVIYGAQGRGCLGHPQQANHLGPVAPLKLGAGWPLQRLLRLHLVGLIRALFRTSWCKTHGRLQGGVCWGIVD